MIPHLCRTLAAACCLTLLAGTPLSAQPDFTHEDITYLVLPGQNPVSDQTPERAVALIGPFHETGRHWWDDAEAWGFPDAPDDRLAQALAMAEASLSDLQDEAVAAGLGSEQADDMRLYPVEAMTLWLCVVREGCYPKGVMVGTDMMDHDAALALCESLEATGRQCGVAMVL